MITIDSYNELSPLLPGVPTNRSTFVGWSPSPVALRTRAQDRSASLRVIPQSHPAPGPQRDKRTPPRALGTSSLAGGKRTPLPSKGNHSNSASSANSARIRTIGEESAAKDPSERTPLPTKGNHRNPAASSPAASASTHQSAKKQTNNEHKVCRNGSQLAHSAGHPRFFIGTVKPPTRLLCGGGDVGKGLGTRRLDLQGLDRLEVGTILAARAQVGGDAHTFLDGVDAVGGRAA